MAEDLEKDRLGAALGFVLRRYVAQVRRWPFLAAGAFLLPAVGDVLTLYAPPLVVARLLGVFASSRQLTKTLPSGWCTATTPRERDSTTGAARRKVEANRATPTRQKRATDPWQGRTLVRPSRADQRPPLPVKEGEAG